MTIRATIADIDVKKGDDCPEGWDNDTVNGIQIPVLPDSQ